MYISAYKLSQSKRSCRNNLSSSACDTSTFPRKFHYCDACREVGDLRIVVNINDFIGQIFGFSPSISAQLREDESYGEDGGLRENRS